MENYAMAATGKKKKASSNGTISPLPVIRYAPIHDQILPHLRRGIVENRWKSGERLSEPQLCREFGVSRTPLRQALKTLEAEGLVQLVPHVGAVVTAPNATDVGETMEILIGLEQLAVTRLTQLQPEAVLKDILGIYEDMKQAAQQLNAQRYLELNDQFHFTIVRGTGNRSLTELHEKVMWHVHRERLRANEEESVTPESGENHDDIVRAILARKPEKAGLAMRQHLEQISQLMLTRRHQEQEAESDVKKAGKGRRGNAKTGQRGHAG
jgi:DNA-binding GntR family transcriptional regulator